jgi:tetratricopeptide (TPR) repeat protein
MKPLLKKCAALGLASLFAIAAPVYATDSLQSMTPEQQLAYTAQNKNESTEKRAEALRQLARYPNQNSLVAVARGLKDPAPMIREAAVIGSDLYQFKHRWQIVSPLLTDSELSVRMAATANLLREYNQMSASQQAQIEAPYQEVTAYLTKQQDSASQLLLADVYRWHGEWSDADIIYQELVKIAPDNSQIWLNLSDNYRAQNQDDQALLILDKAIVQLPKEASLYYSKALTQARLSQKKQAAQSIQAAADLAENNSYYWYLNGVLHEDIDLKTATESFEQAYLISGSPEQLYAVCDIYVRYGNDKAEACLEELAKVAPDYVIAQLKEKQK